MKTMYIISCNKLYFKDFMGESPNGLAKWTNKINDARLFNTKAMADFYKKAIIPYNSKIEIIEIKI